MILIHILYSHSTQKGVTPMTNKTKTKIEKASKVTKQKFHTHTQQQLTIHAKTWQFNITTHYCLHEIHKTNHKTKNNKHAIKCLLIITFYFKFTQK